jgi:hypothetical protein
MRIQNSRDVVMSRERVSCRVVVLWNFLGQMALGQISFGQMLSVKFHSVK